MTFFFFLVAELPLRLVIPPRLPHRTAVLQTHARAFSAAADFDGMVEWDPDDSSTNLLAGRRFQGEHVC